MHNTKLSALVISGSIRSRIKSSDFIFQTAIDSENLNDFVSKIKKYQNKNVKISNTDIISGAAIIAMREYGAHVDFFPLARLFSNVDKRKEVISVSENLSVSTLNNNIIVNQQQYEELKEKIGISSGVMLATPVYFGDRSSVANKLLQLSSVDKLLEGKAFGASSVAAKRNGGQETAILYALFEAQNQSALVVGNGPPTSQYGGTAVAGKIGSAINDAWGLETTYGTGARIAYISDIINEGRDTQHEQNVKILILITMDNADHVLFDYVQALVASASKELSGVEFEVVNILNYTIYRCLGCDNCPVDQTVFPREGSSNDLRAHCILESRNDDMFEDIHRLLTDADGVAVAGLNVKDLGRLHYRYQVLIERTRCLRRDNFELTDKLMAALSLNEVGARVNSLHSLKTMTSYIRHNTVVHKSIEAYFYKDEILDYGLADFKGFANQVKLVTAGKKKVRPVVAEYVKTGIGGY